MFVAAVVGDCDRNAFLHHITTGNVIKRKSSNNTNKKKEKAGPVSQLTKGAPDHVGDGLYWGVTVGTPNPTNTFLVPHCPPETIVPLLKSPELAECESVWCHMSSVEIHVFDR